jgi:hypothetical protein
MIVAKIGSNWFQRRRFLKNLDENDLIAII